MEGGVEAGDGRDDGEQVAHRADPGDRPDTSYAVQGRVRHDDFGDGIVTDMEEDRLTVLFDDVGYRTLALDLAEGGLLEALD